MPHVLIKNSIHRYSRFLFLTSMCFAHVSKVELKSERESLYRSGNRITSWDTDSCLSIECSIVLRLRGAGEHSHNFSTSNTNLRSSSSEFDFGLGQGSLDDISSPASEESKSDFSTTESLTKQESDPDATGQSTPPHYPQHTKTVP